MLGSPPPRSSGSGCAQVRVRAARPPSCCSGMVATSRWTSDSCRKGHEHDTCGLPNWYARHVLLTSVFCHKGRQRFLLRHSDGVQAFQRMQAQPGLCPAVYTVAQRVVRGQYLIWAHRKGVEGATTGAQPRSCLFATARVHAAQTLSCHSSINCLAWRVTLA